jgi:hypothetical protein
LAGEKEDLKWGIRPKAITEMIRRGKWSFLWPLVGDDRC